MNAALESIASLKSDDWLRFLERQRWFAGKRARATAARVVSVAIVPWGDGALAIARLVVALDAGERTYQVPIAIRDAPPPDVPAHAVIATATRTVYDAVYDADFRSGLAAALSTGATARSDDGTAWIVEPVVGALALTSPIATAVGSAEQSNTSLIVNDAVIVKLFRTLQPGIHPDVELTELLTTRASFRNTPRSVATIRFDDHSSVTVAGMAQIYLPGSTDAWRYALDRGQAYFAAPPERDVENAFVADAARLGAVTRELHEALASIEDLDDVTPVDATHDDLDAWAARAKALVRDALSLLAWQLASPSFPAAHADEARALVGRRDHYTSSIDEIVDALGDDLGQRTRVHGDYHLGQVLRTPSREFMIIDFEGEPSRLLSERRAKTSPLRDVAGMLRSFAYAAATLATTAGAKLEAHTRELRAARWERDVRNAFLDAYLAGGAGHDDDESSIIPESAEHVRELVALFETEKAFYELEYELNHRPAWAWIPMRGIAKLLARA